MSGTDKTIRELKGMKKPDGTMGEGLPHVQVLRVLEQSVNLSQITLMHNRRAIFTAVDEKDRPGSIQCIRGDMQVTKENQNKDIFEIQAHSLDIQRLKLSFDNQTLFSSSSDGSLCVFALADRDPKKKILDLPQIQLSTDILIPKMQRDKIQQDIYTLQTAINQEKQNKQHEADMQRSKYERKIQELTYQRDEKIIQNKAIIENLDKEVEIMKC